MSIKAANRTTLKVTHIGEVIIKFISDQGGGGRFNIAAINFCSRTLNLSTFC